ncbi:hypothetical protein L873DRAFT_1320931 [Choiromyces venosus 120613-1]|uniref:Uncharacterized protein n=1 Tax=Choiromyces venosus 120613-1 TaxID=1336337 RepID=A0A3N4JDD3_9PEZI|nr:hypothetical protein L873DRAFT_1320931 [Choiromyces venosus 120613-1]
MTDQSPCFLYKETCVNLDWDDSYGNILNIFLPIHHSGPTRRTSSHKNIIKRPEPDKPDTLFQYRHLATAASVYYRPIERYPRCILWRVLEEAQVLSLTSVDFTKPHDARGEPPSTFRFYFPDTIRPGCVGFADAPDKDELVVYVMTTGNIIYTLNLSADFFLRSAVTRKTSKDSDYCRTFSPSSFTLHSPHYLIAIDHETLLVSLQDGVLLKLEKSDGLPEDPEMSISRYVEKTFSEGTYMAFFKNRMPYFRPGTVKHGRDNVSFSVVISSAVYFPRRYEDSMGEGHQVDPLLFTVSVDHTLKTWSLNRGILLHATDLLNETAPPPTKMKTLLSPSPSQLLTVVDTSFQDNHMFYLVSFSSATTGKFKFWAAQQGMDGEYQGLVDLYPDEEFTADPPTLNSVWMISEFRVTPVAGDNNGLLNLWVLWKSNTTFRVQNLQFHVLNVGEYWNTWVTATADSLHGLPGIPPSNVTSEDITDYWMDWIFCPGRLSDSILLTALDIHRLFYWATTGSPVDDPVDSLQGRVAKAIPGAVELHKTEDGSPDYTRYNHELNTQWVRYARLCTELDKQRCEALSLVADPHTGFVWTVNADGITTLRECTESEMMQHNHLTFALNKNILTRRSPRKLGAGLANTELSDAMLLVQAATNLRNSLTGKLYENCMWRLQREVLEDGVFAFEDRMLSLYQNCLEGEISDDDWDKFEEATETMNDPQTAFYSILSSLFQAEGHAGATKLTSFGGKVLVAGSREVIHINHDILFGLVFVLLMLVFEGGHPKIDNPDSLYLQLLNYMREYEVLNWMARTPLSIPDSRLSADDELAKGLAGLKVTGSDQAVVLQKKKGSVLQLMLSENCGPPPHGPGRSGSVAISVCIRQYLASLELTNHGNGFANVGASLLGINAFGIAMEFQKYLPATSWGFYVRARIQLKDRSKDTAAVTFKKAAYGLAMANPAYFSAIKSLMSEIDLETSIGKGLPQYYLHVACLFEEAKAPEYLVEFCQLALTALGDEDRNPPETVPVNNVPLPLRRGLPSTNPLHQQTPPTSRLAGTRRGNGRTK